MKRAIVSDVRGNLEALKAMVADIDRQGVGVAGESPRGREPVASSNSRRPEFLDRLADLVPPPRKHRHRYHRVFAPNHKLRRAVTALAIGNIGKPRDAGAGGHAGNTHATGCCDTQAKPR